MIWREDVVTKFGKDLANGPIAPDTMTVAYAQMSDRFGDMMWTPSEYKNVSVHSSYAAMESYRRLSNAAKTSPLSRDKPLEATSINEVGILIGLIVGSTT